MNDFVHLHVHTKYSLLDGLCRPEELIKRVRELGQSAVAITDHGNMFGVIEFYKLAKKEGIKPVIGSEMYVAQGNMHDKSPYNHLILLAKNDEGYHNLAKLSSYSYTEGFYYKPRVDSELLRKYSGGLICLTACLYGAVAQALVNDDITLAEKSLNELIDIFGKENTFMEIQNHKLSEQKKILPEQVKLARKHGIGLVATNDVHYINREDAFYQEVLMCIQMQKTLSDDDRMRFETDEMFLKSREEMEEAFPGLTEALDNTVKIADMCSVEIEFGNYHLPHFEYNGTLTHAEYLKELCVNGLKERYENWEEHLPRLEYELNTINNMGFTDYFLIVWDFISYAKKKKIPVGPGRGSAAGSLVAYTLKITNLDPIKYGLIFERFLNSERVTMPDIDIDFCYERRGEVIDYVIKKYGEDRVTQIITFGTLGAKQAIRDVTRVLSYPYALGDEISSLIPKGINVSIGDSMKESLQLKEKYNEDPDTKKIIDIALKIEGLPRHCSTHAAGVVISALPVMEYVPLYKNDEVVSTQYTMTVIEELGLLKMDFLGLRNLTVINDTVKTASANTGKTVDIEKIPLDDANVYSLFAKGDTDGVFQFESPGMRRFLREFKPASLEDLILAVSIYRPGPMQEIPTLIKNKENPSLISYETPELEDILSLTYGCIVYQEQVMQIFRKLADYTLGKADIVRKAMSKKKMDVLEREEIIFIEGCAKNGIKESVAKNIFAKIREFAKYAFNKSHAACYALVAYYTAYLKYYYKAEFMAALMTSFNDNQNKIIKYLKACEKDGIRVRPPMINKSLRTFTVSGGEIIFGLSAVKNVGENFSDMIVAERERHGPFTDFIGFITRMSGSELNKRAVECLIKAGAFDEFEERPFLLKEYEGDIDSVLHSKRSNVPGQISMFAEEAAPKKKPRPLKEYEGNLYEVFLRMEKDVLGLYVSDHPLEKYKKIISGVATASSNELAVMGDEDYNGNLKNNDRVTLAGIISSKNVRVTKNGNDMAIIDLEDLYGQSKIIIFPKIYSEYSNLLTDDAVISVTGRISVTDDEIKLIAESISLISGKEDPSRLYIRLTDRSKLHAVKEILKKHHGGTAVYVYFEDTKTNTLADKSMWASLDSPVADELENLLGKDNIKIVN